MIFSVSLRIEVRTPCNYFMVTVIVQTYLVIIRYPGCTGCHGDETISVHKFYLFHWMVVFADSYYTF